MTTVKINDVEMSVAAAEFAEETASDPRADACSLVEGGCSDEWFLDECLKGADDDRIDGAHEYYHAVAALADRIRECRENAQLDAIASLTTI
jgi:hypothetical protein